MALSTLDPQPRSQKQQRAPACVMLVCVESLELPVRIFARAAGFAQVSGRMMMIIIKITVLISATVAIVMLPLCRFTTNVLEV